jgi:outer membrane receptor protein involved in Fe transport
MKINSLLKYIFLLILSFSYFNNNLFAQDANIKGTVTDAVSGEPSPATIKVFDEDGNVVTGTVADIVTGEYSITIAPGIYKVNFSFMGMEPQNFDIELAKGEVKEIIVQMAEEINPMREVTVTGSKSGTQLAKNTVSIDVVKPALVDNTNATKVDDVVDKVPGVNVVDGQANIRGGAGWSYGAGSRVLILVDDLPFMSADAGSANWRDIPVENIDQIEVLKGAASALYGSSALNGIINIRTGYAKAKRETKFSIFQTSFVAPKDRMMPSRIDPNVMVPVTNLDWWNQDQITTDVNVSDEYTAVDTSFAPRYFAGPLGFRKPIELGASFGHKQKFGKFDLTVGGYGFFSDSYLAGSYERKIRVNSNMRYRFSDSLHVGVNINANYGKSASFFIWGNSNFFLTGLSDSLSFMTLPGTITASTINRINVDPYLTAYDRFGNRHRLQTRIYYINNANANNQSNSSTLFYGEYQYQRQFKKLADLKVVSGAVGQYSMASAQLFGNASYDVYNAAGYLQVEKGFIKDDFGNDKLIFSFGARYEMNAIFSPDSVLVSPTKPRIKNPNPRSIEAKPVFRAGVNYEITPVTFIRASWGQGYRFPTIAERYITTSVGSGSSSLEIRANPSLESETGWSGEIGIKQGFMISRGWKGFVDVSGFITQYQNMMEFTFGGGDTSEINRITLGGLNNPNNPNPLFFQSANIGNTNVIGGELSVIGMGKIGSVEVNILSGYTFIDPRFRDFTPLQQLLSSDSSNILKYRSRHNIKFDIEAFFLKKNNLSVGFSINYNSRMIAIDKVFEDLVLEDNNDPSRNIPVDAFGVARYRRNVNAGENLNIGFRVGYRHAFMNADNKKEKMALKLSLVGKNMLNQEYSIRPALVGAPMNLTVRLDVEF